jgi:hypothetical protein
MSTRAHIAVAILAVGVFVFILRLVRRRQLRAKYSVLWLSVGVALAVLAAAPGLLTWVAHRLNVYYEPALLFVGGIGFLLVIALHFSWELSRLEERTRTLAEENALLRLEVERMQGPDGAAPTRSPQSGEPGRATTINPSAT